MINSYLKDKNPVTNGAVKLIYNFHAQKKFFLHLKNSHSKLYKKKKKFIKSQNEKLPNIQILFSKNIINQILFEN